MLARARGVARDAAPLRRRRVARAAHAADEPADEHRRPARRDELDARGAASGCSTTSTASRRRCASLIGGLLELARGEDAAARAQRAVQLDELVEAAVGARAHALPGGDVGDGSWSRRSSTATRSGWSARSGTCSRTPASGAARRRRGRGRARGRRAARARPRARDRGRGPAARLRALLPLGRRAGDARVGLGLAIVREVAEAHGGTVVAEERAGRRRAAAARPRRGARAGTVAQRLDRRLSVLSSASWFDCRCSRPLRPVPVAGRDQPGPASSRIPCGEDAGLCWLEGPS